MHERAISLSGTPVGAPARAAMMPLHVRGLGYEAGGRRLVDGLDLTLDGHGITMVMGHNGAGKSLLLRLLHGLIEPSEGEILWDGQPVSTATRARQSLVFQKPVLLRRSVGANIDLVLKARGLPRARRNPLLGRIGLADRASQPARLLSGGEAQRLSLARALASDPRVLFLDEPTANLDPGSVLAIEEIVRETAREGVRIIFVSHDIAQARRLADEVVLMRNGRVEEHGPAESFFTTPQTRAARDFLAGRLTN